MASDTSDCPFCRKFSKNGEGRQAVFDQILWEDDNFVLVPAAGCFIVGYVLLIPRHHYTSMSELPPELLAHVGDIKMRIRSVLAKIFTTPIFFEHGIVISTNRGGACVEHAHLHCVATEIDLASVLSAKHKLSWRQLGKYEDVALQVLRKESYVYYENQDNQMFIFSDEKLPSQYMRRLLAEKLGYDGPEWDYAVFQFKDNAQRTAIAFRNAAL